MATPRSVRYLNEMGALNTLFRLGGMSRAELARQLGLNRSSVGYIIQDLLADGLAREGPAVSPVRGGRGGRPGIVVELDPRGASFLGVEIGVDHLTVVAIDLAAREILRRSMDYATSQRTPDAGLARVADFVAAAIESLGDRRDGLRGISVAIPALVRDGVVRNALMIGWHDVPLRRELTRRLRTRLAVEVENDANAFTVGETYRGAPERAGTIVALLIENGAGGGIVIDGKLVRGSAGYAGEFGQLPVGGEGFGPGRHRRGHLESYIGKDAVVQRYRANGAPPSADLQHLLASLRAGDAIARKTAGEWAEHLARGLAHVCDMLDPSLVILGGSVASLYPFVADRVEAVMRDEFLEGFPVPTIELSRLGDEAVAFGSACLLHQRMFSVDERAVHTQGESELRASSSEGRTSTSARRRRKTGREGGHGR